MDFRKMYMRRAVTVGIIVIFAIMLIAAGCGRKTPPVPPEQASFSTAHYLSYFSACSEAFPEAINDRAQG